MSGPNTKTDTETEVAIVGSGFSGIAMAVRLKQEGVHDFVVLERAGDIGGTWRDNHYPGCACDVPSHLYSYSFAPKPDWSQTFSPQPEIQAYLKAVAEEHGVLEHVRFGAELEDAVWDETAARWRLRTPAGALSARVIVSAAGALSDPKIPDLPGLDTFTGTVFHSAQWPEDHDLTGERVAVVGTGASAIQFVPRIQPQVAELKLFQRTPPWIMPRRQRPLTRLEQRVYARVPAAQRAMRGAIYWARESFALPFVHGGLAKYTRKVAEAHMHRQVDDPGLREKLTPDYLPGCKRILVSNDYLPALDNANVEVLTEGVAEVRGRTVVGTDGSEREVDTIVFGTGFTVTDLPIAGRITGREGRTLRQHWDDGMEAYKGTAVSGFPNLFFLVGPNTGLGHTSIVFMIETQVEYVLGALRHLGASGRRAIEPRREAQDAWNAAIQRRMAGTVWSVGGCQSWYLDKNGRNTTLWPDFTFRFRQALRRFDADRWVASPAPAAPAPLPVAA